MDEAPHVLIVDDDTRIRELLGDFLRINGFRVTTAGSAGKAREKMRALAFDVLVLDIMMPGESGLELTRDLREKGQDMPILLLSALAEPPDRIRGLASGSDDYLVKPFEPQELLLRLKALLRRRPAPEAGMESGEVRFGDCLFRLATGELLRGGEQVRLTGREREILRLLARNAGRTVPREALVPPGGGDNPRTADVQINRLRRKIEKDPSAPAHLCTVRGEGYVLKATASGGAGQ